MMRRILIRFSYIIAALLVSIFSSAKPIYFNTKLVKNDLIGELQGAVLFAQSNIIPSRASVQDADIQPHLVQQRDTLVIFRPLSSATDESDPVKLSVISATDNIIAQYQMLPSANLPKIAEYVDCNEFTEPSKYDYVVNTQKELNKMKGDLGGENISDILKDKSNMQIITSNSAWIKHFYLPAGIGSQKIITFDNSSDYYITAVHVNNKVWLGGKNAPQQKLSFKNCNGIWVERSEINYSKIQYSDNLWSVRLPAHQLHPRIKLLFTYDNRSGEYVDINVGAPNELLLHTIDIGMLTPYRDKFTFKDSPQYHQQYFQQIPVSRMIVNEYESVTIDKIILPNGVVYTDQSSENGGYYKGDMRELIAKELISLGINNANYGINSTAGINAYHPYSAAQIVLHNAIGAYNNGIKIHGLSGGNGMATLYDSVYNEFSHELGHNFGMGHYPNGFYGSIHAPADTVNSTWGWNNVSNQFIPNFAKYITNKATCYRETDQCQQPFHGHSYGKDAMSGGMPNYPSVNAYTLHTPYTLSKIQEFLESKVQFDRTSSTGFSKWNNKTKLLEPWISIVQAVYPDRADEESISQQLAASEILKISFADGYWTNDIYIPNASPANVSKVINIDHNATYASNVHINNSSQKISKGDILNLQSDGERWQQIQSIPLDLSHKPMKQGVAVTTLVGFYDPEDSLNSYIYPALHGAYGNVFSPNSFSESSVNVCNALIQNQQGEEKAFILAGYRINEAYMNKFHINIAASFQATDMQISCNDRLIVAATIQPPKKKLRYTVTGYPFKGS